MATLALQHPDLAAEQLDHAVKKLGLRGAAIGGSVEGQELSDRKFDPFWAKAQELGIVLFMHPQPAPGTTQNQRLQGKGLLGNTIGNPLETTVFLSHLIFEGTLDRFPGLKICAAHAGGYLTSYSGRSDALCGRAGGNGDDCRALKKKPSEYFRRELLVDTMIFHEDGLRHLVAEAGVGQIVYGTDYPFDWPVGIDFVLNAKFLSNTDKEAILGGNAMKLLRDRVGAAFRRPGLLRRTTAIPRAQIGGEPDACARRPLPPAAHPADATCRSSRCPTPSSQTG